MRTPEVDRPCIGASRGRQASATSYGSSPPSSSPRQRSPLPVKAAPPNASPPAPRLLPSPRRRLQHRVLRPRELRDVGARCGGPPTRPVGRPGVFAAHFGLPVPDAEGFRRSRSPTLVAATAVAGLALNAPAWSFGWHVANVVTEVQNALWVPKPALRLAPTTPTPQPTSLPVIFAGSLKATFSRKAKLLELFDVKGSHGDRRCDARPTGTAAIFTKRGDYALALRGNQAHARGREGAPRQSLGIGRTLVTSIGCQGATGPSRRILRT